MTTTLHWRKGPAQGGDLPTKDQFTTGQRILALLPFYRGDGNHSWVSYYFDPQTLTYGWVDIAWWAVVDKSVFPPGPHLPQEKP